MLELKDVIVLVPKSIKLEIINELIENAYQEELKMFQIYGDDFKDFKFHIDRTFISHRWIWGLQEEYKILIDVIKNANLTDEELKTIYLNSIKRRKDLGLKESLFNIDMRYLKDYELPFDKIEEKVKKRKNI